MAQEELDSLVSKDTVAVEKVRFVRPEISFDYGKGFLTAGRFEKRLEGGLSFVFFDHYYLVGEIGTADLQPRYGIRNGSYSSEGNYFRIGGGYQTAINAKSRLGLGARYSVSDFADVGKAEYTSRSGIQGDNTTGFSRSNLQARWIELVLHSESDIRLRKNNPEAKINKIFSLGFQLRLRFLATYDIFDDYDVYAIPGYGRTVNQPNLAANIYLKFNPFR